MPIQNNIPSTLPSVERFIQRVRAAEKSQSKDIRLSIQEARELVSDLALFSAKLSDTMQEMNENLKEIKQSTTKIDVKFDGGGF